jgi:hypothetical protein
MVLAGHRHQGMICPRAALFPPDDAELFDALSAIAITGRDAKRVQPMVRSQCPAPTGTISWQLVGMR